MLNHLPVYVFGLLAGGSLWFGVESAAGEQEVSYTPQRPHVGHCIVAATLSKQFWRLVTICAIDRGSIVGYQGPRASHIGNHEFQLVTFCSKDVLMLIKCQ